MADSSSTRTGTDISATGASGLPEGGRKPIERYCTKPGCEGGDKCQNEYRTPGQSCTMEYVAADYPEHLRWSGDGPPPPRWKAGGGIVYRSFADYCD